jgi:hypothetical protein
MLYRLRTGAQMAEANIGRVTREDRGHVRLLGLDRVKKRNAFDSNMLVDLAVALGEAERDDGVRCAVLFAHGDHFTAGLDLMEIGPLIASGFVLPDGAIDPQAVLLPRRKKPLIVAVRGVCFTIAAGSRYRDSCVGRAYLSAGGTAGHLSVWRHDCAVCAQRRVEQRDAIYAYR